MKKVKYLLAAFCITILNTGSVHAQSLLSEEPRNSIGGGVGYSLIDNVPFISFSFTPDLALGPFGLGIDLTLRVNPTDWSVRTSDWDEIDDIAKVIRYVRVGTKEEKAFDFLYVRVGNLSYASLGHGILMYNFTNSPSIDNRRIGVEFDLDFKYVGLEGIFSDFIDSSVTGGRLYVRPLKFTKLGKIPVIGGLEFGGTFIADFSPDSAITTSVYSPGEPNDNLVEKSQHLAAYAFDVGLPILESDIIKLETYYDWGKYLEYGSGQLIGAAMKFAFPGNIVRLETKLERRWLKDQFVVSHFNSLYLINRYQPATSQDSAIIGREDIESAKAGGGTYGELGFSFFDAFQIIGSYQARDIDPDGLLHLEAKIPPKIIPKIELAASYDRVHINNASDFFALDEDSLLSAMIGYHPLPFILLGVKYNWTFVPNDNGQYDTQTRMEAIFNISYEF